MSGRKKKKTKMTMFLNTELESGLESDAELEATSELGSDSE